MKYAVKLTTKMLGMVFVDYIGLRGKSWKNENEVNGWKRRSSAEKWIKSQVSLNNMLGLNRVFENKYEIISL